MSSTRPSSARYSALPRVSTDTATSEENDETVLLTNPPIQTKQTTAGQLLETPNHKKLRLPLVHIPIILRSFAVDLHIAALAISVYRSYSSYTHGPRFDHSSLTPSIIFLCLSIAMHVIAILWKVLNRTHTFVVKRRKGRGRLLLRENGKGGDGKMKSRLAQLWTATELLVMGLVIVGLIIDKTQTWWLRSARTGAQVCGYIGIAFHLDAMIAEHSKWVQKTVCVIPLPYTETEDDDDGAPEESLQRYRDLEASEEQPTATAGTDRKVVV